MAPKYFQWPARPYATLSQHTPQQPITSLTTPRSSLSQMVPIIFSSLIFSIFILFVFLKIGT